MAPPGTRERNGVASYEPLMRLYRGPTGGESMKGWNVVAEYARGGVLCAATGSPRWTASRPCTTRAATCLRPRLGRTAAAKLCLRVGQPTQGAGATLFYDPLDRLRFVQGGGNEQLVYDTGSGSGAGFSALIAEYDYSGISLLRRYVHGPGIDEPLVWYEGAGTSDRRWLTADERGSIIGTFNDSRAGFGYVAYDEYGRRQVLGSPGRFGFTGQQWLPGSA